RGQSLFRAQFRCAGRGLVSSKKALSPFSPFIPALLRHSGSNAEAATMRDVLSLLNDYAGPIAAAAALLCLLLLVCLAALSQRVRAVTPDMRRLVRELDGLDARGMFEVHLARVSEAISKARDVEDLARELARRQTFSIQKVGLVRFNADANLGGDLSFALALLNDRNDGLILTSIYNLEECRTYAKPVKGGACPVATSDEERQALETALNSQSGPEVAPAGE
ncbi:MAG: DUF4446 family protein, partial [Armatimonadota bacterium]